MRERERAPLDRQARRLPLDHDIDAMALNRAVALVHAKEAPAKVDSDALRAGGGGTLDEGGIVQGGAGLGVHIAGDQRDAALRVAELGLHLLEGVERRVADLELVHVERAEAEVEYLVQELIVADDLGVFGRAEIGKDAVLAEHQEQGLVGARAVGAAGEAVDRLGARGLRLLGCGQRRESVDDKAADDRDRCADGGLAEQA